MCYQISSWSIKIQDFLRKIVFWMGRRRARPRGRRTRAKLPLTSLGHPDKVRRLGAAGTDLWGDPAGF